MIAIADSMICTHCEEVASFGYIDEPQIATHTHRAQTELMEIACIDEQSPASVRHLLVEGFDERGLGPFTEVYRCYVSVRISPTSRVAIEVNRAAPRLVSPKECRIVHFWEWEYAACKVCWWQWRWIVGTGKSRCIAGGHLCTDLLAVVVGSFDDASDFTAFQQHQWSFPVQPDIRGE